MKPFFIVLFAAVTSLNAQLAVTVSPLKVAEQKAIVPLVLKNNFGENIESARAAVFLLGENGKRMGQTTRWVIGGTTDRPGLAAGTTNVFNFVVTADKPITTTNLTAQVIFSRVIMEGGKVVDPVKAVQIQR